MTATIVADDRTQLTKELTDLLNKYSVENGSDTPDFILAEYMTNCLAIFNKAVAARTEWYGHGQPTAEATTLEANPVTNASVLVRDGGIANSIDIKNDDVFLIDTLVAGVPQSGMVRLHDIKSWDEHHDAGALRSIAKDLKQRLLLKKTTGW